jgi:hypothetical protein
MAEHVGDRMFHVATERLEKGGFYTPTILLKVGGNWTIWVLHRRHFYRLLWTDSSHTLRVERRKFLWYRLLHEMKISEPEVETCVEKACSLILQN